MAFDWRFACAGSAASQSGDCGHRTPNRRLLQRDLGARGDEVDFSLADLQVDQCASGSGVGDDRHFARVLTTAAGVRTISHQNAPSDVPELPFTVSASTGTAPVKIATTHRAGCYVRQSAVAQRGFASGAVSGFGGERPSPFPFGASRSRRCTTRAARTCQFGTGRIDGPAAGGAAPSEIAPQMVIVSRRMEIRVRIRALPRQPAMAGTE